jgi:hypothetical protein
MEGVPLPQLTAQIVTAVVASLAFGLSLYNFYLQKWGKLHCHLFERYKKGLTLNKDGDGVYTFDIRFFNEKTVATGIRDCTIAFYDKNGSRQFADIEIFPKDAISQRRADALTFKPQEFKVATLEVKVGELAETLSKKRKIEIKDQDVKKIIKEADRVELEASFPTDKPFKEKIRRKNTE